MLGPFSCASEDNSPTLWSISPHIPPSHARQTVDHDARIPHLFHMRSRESSRSQCTESNSTWLSHRAVRSNGDLWLIC